MMLCSEIVTSTDDVLEVYAYCSSNYKYSKTLEYTPLTTNAITNYNYKIYLNRQSRYIGINSIDYNLIDPNTITRYMFYNSKNKNITISSDNNEYLKGITIYNTAYTTVLSVNDKVYGDINHVSIVYDTFDGMEKISILHGNVTEYILYISYDKLL